MTDRTAGRRTPTHYLTGDGQRVPPRRRGLAGRLLRLCVWLTCLGTLAGGTAVCGFLVYAQRTPREWAPYLQRRALRHRPAIVETADLAAWWLDRADRMDVPSPPVFPMAIGASPDRSGVSEPGAGRLRKVSALQDLIDAVGTAMPGDVIELRPGHYLLRGYSPIRMNRPGTAAAPITVRAARLGDVTIESDTVQTFVVSAPFWRFENLHMKGICPDFSVCEHALHIVGGATDLTIRNNWFEDYNAHLKINAEEGLYPDRGRIEGNTFTDSMPRATRNPLTPIDMVTASNWHIDGNAIADFQRAGDEGGATYGAFVKGAGEGNVLEGNLVICEWKLHGDPRPHVGLSLGGGGTGPGLFRDGGRSGAEQIGGTIRNNVVAMCNDDGIYLNKAAGSSVEHNTLIDTAGIDARFVETSGTIAGNLVDGAVRSRDGAVVAMHGNDVPFLLYLFAGLHPQRAYFRDPAALDLRWTTPPGRWSDAGSGVDFCGVRRVDPARPGAFDDYTACFGEK